ncbi:MAG: phosphoribosylglycinamide formyltransferase [Nocardioidaceae bacterium]
MAYRVAVLVSGEGTNLQALLDTVHGRRGIEVACVAASRSEARALERATRAGVERAVFAIAAHRDRAARDRALADWLAERRVDLLVLAGWMEILGSDFIHRFERRIVNIHPSLLPAFRGVHAIEQALGYGVKVTGVTVHFVDEGVDSGPIILQEPLDLSYCRDVAEVEERLHEIEHRLLPHAVRLLAAGAVRLDPDNPRLVHVDDA